MLLKINFYLRDANIAYLPLSCACSFVRLSVRMSQVGISLKGLNL